MLVEETAGLWEWRHFALTSPREEAGPLTPKGREDHCSQEGWRDQARASILEVPGAQHKLQHGENHRASDLVTRNKDKAPGATSQLDQPQIS